MSEIMNNSTTHNDMSTSQPQRGDGSALGEYFNNGLQSFANYPSENETPHEEFLWDPSLFNPSQLYSPPVATHTPAWNQNATAQSRDPPLTAYGGLQSSFQLSQYGQQSFDPRQPSPQPVHDPRLMSRPSPAPTQYHNPNHAASLGYRDLSYSNQQQFNPQTMVYPQRPSSTSTPGYDGHANRSPYFNYGAPMAGQSQLQGIDLPNNLAGFPEQQQRPTAPFIDPSFLTASTLQRPRPETAQDLYPFIRQENVQTQPSGQQTPLSASPNDVQGNVIPTNHAGNFMGVFVPPKPEKAPTKARKPKDPNAPKRPRGRPRKDALQVSAKPETDAFTSDSDSDELQIEEMPEPIPDLLRGPPPENAEYKVIYDVAVAVWSPRNKPAVAEKVRNGIALFGDVVKKQRDAWKVKNEALKQAELANTTAIPSLKQEVAEFRKTIETMAVQALRFGHPSHLAKLGENPFTMSALQSFLVDRINALDMDGSLVKSILQLMSRFTTLDEEMLEKTKTSKILTRLTKKAGNEVKDLAQAVLDHAASASRRKLASAAKPNGVESPNAMNDQKNSLAAGLKRPREADVANFPATKRTVVPTVIKQASKPLALQNAERKKLDLAAIKSKNAATVTNGTPSTVPAAPPKPSAAVVPPKPVPSPFSGLMSASKKPGTSIAARAAAAKERAKVVLAPAAKKPSPPPATVVKAETTVPPVTKSTFSFMDTLADMSRPKPVEEKKVDEKPPETEEERMKRLRKEERRKLRVSWAPENELTQVRMFVHDPEEEIGQADSAMRDVDDVGGEGRMLKLHKDLEDLDDEDDGRATVEELEPYRSPTEVDFTVIAEAARRGSFMRRGGTEKPESAEREAQDLREQTTLMVVYALPSEVPPTPKEPPAAADEDDYAPLTSFGEPEEKTRLREAKYYEQTRTPPQSAAQTPDIAAIINLMKQNQPQPAQQPAFNLFTPQPQPQQQPAQGVDISKILAVMSHLQQPQPQPQPQQQPIIPQPQQQGAQVNLAALLAQFQQPAPPAQQSLPYSYNSNPNPYAGVDNDYSRKHSRNESSSDYDDYAWKKKRAESGSAKPHPKAKTVICKFWQEGKCKKGDDCTFIHE